MGEGGMRKGFVMMREYGEVGWGVRWMRVGGEEYMGKKVVEEKVVGRIREVVGKRERRDRMGIVEGRSGGLGRMEGGM